jgi:hypothetical protein
MITPPGVRTGRGYNRTWFSSSYGVGESKVKVRVAQEQFLSNSKARIEENAASWKAMARQVKAIRVLLEGPELLGVNPRRLERVSVRQRRAKREQALQTAVARESLRFYYPGAAGLIRPPEIIERRRPGPGGPL